MEGGERSLVQALRAAAIASAEKAEHASSSHAGHAHSFAEAAKVLTEAYIELSKREE